MAKWLHSDVLDNGVVYIKTNCNKVLLLKNYTAGDSYATVTGGTVKVAEATLVTGDFTLANGASSSRTLTAGINGKSGGNALINTVNDTDNLHIAFVDTVNSKVLWVTDESTDQSITAGTPVTFASSPVHTSNQPA